MKQRIINGHALEFFDSSNTKKGEIKISGSDIIINPLDGNGTVIFGEQGTVNDIEVGAVGTPVDFTFAGGGTITSNGGTLTIGTTGDTIDLSNATIGAITASAFVGGTFEGDGAGLTGVVPDLSGYNGNVVVTGSLQVTGRVTAEEFHTEFVSSSIVFSSGSTKFGDTADDLHEFTGSIKVESGSVNFNTFGQGVKWIPATNSSNFIRLSSAQNLQIGAGGVIQLYKDTEILNGSSLKLKNGGSSTALELYNAGGSGQYRLDIVAGSTSLMVVSGSGKVGIGTDNPLAGLEVANAENSTLRLTRSSNTANYLQLQGGSSGAIYNINTSGTQDHIFQTGGNEKMRLTSAGHLGINTTSPESKLTVVGSGGAGDAAITSRYSNSSVLGEVSTIAHRNSQWNTLYVSESGGSATNAVFVEGNKPVIFNAGNVGIGTTSPSERLDVSGSIKLDSKLIVDGVEVANPTPDTDQVRLTGYGMIGNRGTLYITNAWSGGTVQIGNGSTHSADQTAHFSATSIRLQRNVGINRTNTGTPPEALTVEGAISASGNIHTQGALLLDGVDGLHLNQGAASTFSPTPGIFYSGTSGQGWYFQVPNNGQEKFSFKLGSTAANREFRVVDPSWNSLFQVQGTGDAIIANNLTVGGTVTAQEFHTEFVSASIIYQSGSTKFGDTSDDIHEFTGSTHIHSGSYKIDTYGEGIRWYNGTNYTTNRIQLSTAQNMQLQAGGIIQLQSSTQIVNGRDLMFNNSGNITRFDINNAGASGQARLDFSSGSATYMSISGSGNVGIGTTSPTKTLDVRGSMIISGSFSGADANALTLDNTDSSGNPSIMRMIFSGEGGNEALQIGMFSSPTIKPVYFQSTQGSGWGNIIFQRYGGRVGIRTLEPSANLTVQGNGTTTGKTFLAQDSNASALFTILDNGNVGIGTTSPSEKLDVNGNIKATKLLLNTTNTGYTLYSAGESRINGVIFQQTSGTDYLQKASGTGDFYVRNTVSGENIFVGAANSSGQFTNYLKVDGANNDATIRTNDVDRLYISSSGNVGIGTTSPSEKLEVAGKAIVRRTGTATAHADTDLFITDATAAGSTAQIEILGGNAGNSMLYFSDPDSYSQGAIQYLHSTDNMNIRVNGSTAMTIDSSRNVGIGTTTPSYKLQVNGTARFGDGSPYLKVTSTAVEVEGSYLLAGYQSGVSFYAYESVFRGLIKSDSSGGNALKLGDTAERMRIIGGNVGIGTTSPSASLHVSGTADVFLIEGSGSTANTSIFAIDGNNGRLFEVSDDLSDSLFSVNTIAGLPVMEVFSDNRVTMGAFNQNDLVISGSKVGIGTATPAHKLSVDGNIQLPNGGFIYGQSTGNYLKLDNATYVELGYSSTTAVRADGSAVSIRGTGGTPRLTVQSAGNVGIGTTSPDSPLEIYSDSTTDFLKLTSGNSTANPIKLIFEKSATEQGIIEYNRNGDLEIYNTDGDGGVMLNGRNSEAGDLYVADGGNVGIGTTSPAYKLHVNGTARFEDAITLSDDVNNRIDADTTGLLFKSAAHYTFSKGANTLMFIKETGNVGIGTTSPSHTLDVAQVADNQGIKLSGYDDQSSRTYLQYVDQNGHISLVASSGANLNYTVQDGHFNVNLNTSTKDFRVKDSGGSTVLNVTGDSKVGIGLTAPVETLHLSGSMRIDGAGTGAVQEQSGAPDTAYTNSSETNFYMGAPDRYLKIVLDGTTYLIPAYTPA